MSLTNTVPKFLTVIICSATLACAMTGKPRVWEPDLPDAECGIKREQKLLSLYSTRKSQEYSSLLIPLENYTTRGRFFHVQYHRHLISVAVDLVENRGMTIAPESVGFYYDRTSRDIARLYLGLDIDTGKIIPGEFRSTARRLIRSDLKGIIESAHSCSSAFNEDQVVGILAGWIWNAGGAEEHLSIWIIREDIIAYENSRLTFEELVHRSTITDTGGIIIRLPI